MTSPGHADQIFLRETATSMRETHPMSHPRHLMWEQFALLMEETAASPKTIGGYADPRIMEIARAYQSAVGRPDINEEV